MEKSAVSKATTIDFVITWVDGSDPEWLRSKHCFQCTAKADDAVERYRDWGLLKFWFRGVEAFAPWVRRIHFVTCGHVPNWLETNHPQLHIVRHADYMPLDACPTFNSNAIELGMHRIPGLAEQFVYFNDDTYLLRSMQPTDFFRNGHPCDDAILSPIMPNWGEEIARTVLNNMYLINKHFTKQSVWKQHKKIFLTPRYGIQLLRTLCLMPWRHFPGFKNDHLPIAYLKSTFEHVWACEPELLNKVIHHRFRHYESDVSHWLMRYWQFCEGTIAPASVSRGRDLPIDDLATAEAIRRQRYGLICINDTKALSDDFETVQQRLVSAFESILPKKCSFEKEAT